MIAWKGSCGCGLSAGVEEVNRQDLRQLAQDRLQDAAALLAVGRWPGAYYLVGYAVECGLKACIMAHVEATGAIFQDKKFAERCWTHNLEVLVVQANLKPALDALAGANANFSGNWGTANDWEERSRYQQKTQAEAQALYDAISSNPDGVFQWIQNHW
jgi:HEPN domain-containing protein